MIDIQIKKAPAFTVGEMPFVTLAAAQGHALKELLSTEKIGDCTIQVNDQIADWILIHRESILSILRSTGRKPRTSKLNGAKRTRKPKTQEPAQA